MRDLSKEFTHEPPRAALLDYDGNIVNNEYWRKRATADLLTVAFRDRLREKPNPKLEPDNVSVSASELRTTIGGDREKVLSVCSMVAAARGLSFTKEEFSNILAQRKPLEEEAIEKQEIQEYKGVRELVENFRITVDPDKGVEKSTDIIVGVVTNSHASHLDPYIQAGFSIAAILSRANEPVGEKSVVITRDISRRAKPAPDPYLQGAEALNMTGKENRIIAVEDSLPGLIAAKEAGCVTVWNAESHAEVCGGTDTEGFTNTFGQMAISGEADYFVTRFQDLVDFLVEQQLQRQNRALLKHSDFEQKLELMTSNRTTLQKMVNEERSEEVKRITKTG